MTGTCIYMYIHVHVHTCTCKCMYMYTCSQLALNKLLTCINITYIPKSYRYIHYTHTRFCIWKSLHLRYSIATASLVLFQYLPSITAPYRTYEDVYVCECVFVCV